MQKRFIEIIMENLSLNCINNPMKKTLAALALGIALSTFSTPKAYASAPISLPKNLFSCSSSATSENKSSYEESSYKESEKIILYLFNNLSLVRELNFEKKWDMQRGLEFGLGVKFDYEIQINPIKFNPLSFHLNFLFQYNF